MYNTDICAAIPQLSTNDALNDVRIILHGADYRAVLCANLAPETFDGERAFACRCATVFDY